MGKLTGDFKKMKLQEDEVTSTTQHASSFLGSLPNNSTSGSGFKSLVKGKINSCFKYLQRTILENERTRKFIRKSKEFIEFAGEFSRKDLLEIVWKKWKLSVLCFLFGIMIGFFFLSHENSRYEDLSNATLKNTLSFPLPDGFDEKSTRQDNFELLRHFYMSYSRHLLEYEGGHLDSFTNTVKSIKDIDPSLLLKNYTLKSKPVVLPEFGIGWRAKREWYKNDYLKSYKKEELYSVEKNKLGIFHTLNIENAKFEMMNLKKFVDQSVKNKLLLSIDISQLPHLQHDIPRWPTIVSNGFYTHISTNTFITTGKTTRLLKSNNYETIYCQIVGKSELLLFDPFQVDLLYPHKDYPNHVKFDPYNPDEKKYPLSRFARPLKTQLSEGDCLFLPSYWFYSVQANSDLGSNNLNPSDFNIVVEYYYSAISNAHKVSYESFLRGQ